MADTGTVRTKHIKTTILHQFVGILLLHADKDT